MLSSSFFVAFMFSYFVKYATKTWIGLHKDKEETTFHWSDDSPVDYKYWKSYTRPMHSVESCAYQEFSSTVDGRWVMSNNCSQKLPFACKIARVDPDILPKFNGNCSTGWLKYADRCFKYFSLYKDRGTWPEAREKCKSYGGDLVTIDSVEIQKKVHYLIRNDWTPVWTGMHFHRF